MAGDWIKLEKSTVDKPEVALLARKLKITHSDAFVQIVRLFSWADTNVSESGNVPFLSPSEVDTLAHVCPGTCDALSQPDIGWITVDENSLSFHNWSRHNGKSAKKRTLESEKKRNQRSKHQECPPKCPVAIGTNAGPEKRREEKSINTDARAPENSRGLIPGDYLTFQQGLTDACEQWLHLFPAAKRTGPVECARLFPHEVQRIQMKLGNCEEPIAIKHLMQRTQMYIGSWKGKSAKYGYSSETFLRNGCCDEPVEAWDERVDEPKTRKGSRASADAEAMKLLARTGLAEELMNEMKFNGRN